MHWTTSPFLINLPHLVTDLELWPRQKVNLSWWKQHLKFSAELATYVENHFQKPIKHINLKHLCEVYLNFCYMCGYYQDFTAADFSHEARAWSGVENIYQRLHLSGAFQLSLQSVCIFFAAVNVLLKSKVSSWLLAKCVENIFQGL